MPNSLKPQGTNKNMCGLAGFIGLSKKPYVSRLLISKLLEKSERRGVDATGFWAVNLKGDIFYHKEPSPASLFIKNNVWQETLNQNLDLMLVHARGASKGVGPPDINENNHPFTSFDNNIALIHNGRLEDKEYFSLKNNFKLLGDCDSEILIRIYEASEKYPDEHNYKRLNGIKDIFNLINEGHMAVAIGEKIKEERVLWLFRNEYRPLWLIDLTRELNQIFFVSEPDIWFESIEECRFKPNHQKIEELIPGQVWQINKLLEVKKYLNIL